MTNKQFVILCVDDDADILDQMKTVLEANGYRMVGAGSAEAGLKQYKESKPDLVIVDLMMEEVDAGTSLVKELKALGNKAPIFMLSAVGDQLSSNISPTDLGLSGVFQKPIEFKSLLSTLKTKLKA
jgi:Response regulator containing CheY-like receiver, AAA-type ATPase, and DNA-binding domains